MLTKYNYSDPSDSDKPTLGDVFSLLSSIFVRHRLIHSINHSIGSLAVIDWFLQRAVINTEFVVING